MLRKGTEGLPTPPLQGPSGMSPRYGGRTGGDQAPSLYWTPAPGRGPGRKVWRTNGHRIMALKADIVSNHL